jgi:hypothetical protein
MEEVFKSYFRPPWNVFMNLNEFMQQPEENLDEFITKFIVSDIEFRKKHTCPSEEELQFIGDVEEKIEEYKWQKHRLFLKKTMKPLDFLIKVPLRPASLKPVPLKPVNESKKVEII